MKKSVKQLLPRFRVKKVKTQQNVKKNTVNFKTDAKSDKISIFRTKHNNKRQPIYKQN